MPSQLSRFVKVCHSCGVCGVVVFEVVVFEVFVYSLLFVRLMEQSTIDYD